MRDFTGTFTRGAVGRLFPVSDGSLGALRQDRTWGRLRGHGLRSTEVAGLAMWRVSREPEAGEPQDLEREAGSGFRWESTGPLVFTVEAGRAVARKVRERLCHLTRDTLSCRPWAGFRHGSLAGWGWG